MAQIRILLVDDEADILELMTIALRGEGYAVDPVGTVALAHTRLDSLRYELVATDSRLPDGDGMEIADRAADAGSKTIISTGYLFHISAATAMRHELLMK